jgi:hypothetical protein
MAAVSFDSQTRILTFVPAFFKARAANPFVSWRIGIKANAKINEGTILADIFWDDGTDEPITSTVAGTIVRTNRQLSHTTLHRQPAQWALEIA